MGSTTALGAEQVHEAFGGVERSEDLSFHPSELTLEIPCAEHEGVLMVVVCFFFFFWKIF